MNDDSLTAAYALGIIHGLAAVKTAASYTSAGKQSIWNQLFHESKDLFAQLSGDDPDTEEITLEKAAPHA